MIQKAWKSANSRQASLDPESFANSRSGYSNLAFGSLGSSMPKHHPTGPGQCNPVQTPHLPVGWRAVSTYQTINYVFRPFRFFAAAR